MARKKKVSPGNRLVAYYRYSGGSQQTEQSIEGQRRDCEAYARQHGLTIVHEYIDRHISGRGVESRLAFQQMIADSSKHLFDLVICWKTDRFARNRYDSAVYKKKLRDNGVRILYAAESSVEGPEGIILEGLMESLAEYYSAELAQKMRRGMRESALKGRAINPSRPLGLTTDEHKRFIIDEKNAPTIRFIFEHYAAGESSASIVDQLNAAGLRTSKGNSFNKCSIPRIIQNEAYHGVYICKAYDVRIDGAIPAIIDDDLWKKAQKMLTLNKQHRAPHSSHADYLLSGKLFCGCCHSLMRGISGHNCRNDVYYYYACGNKADGGTCKKKNIPKDVAENLVVNAICENILRPDTLEDLADAIAAAQQADVNQPDPERAMLEQNLADVHRKINNIIESIENGTASSRLSARLADLEQQESTLNYQLESLKEVHPPVLDRERILFLLEQFLISPNERTEDYNRRIIDTFVNRIEITDTEMLIYFNLSEASASEKQKNSQPNSCSTGNHLVRLAAQNGKLLFCRFHIRCICLFVEQPQRVDHNAIVLRKRCKRIYFLLRNFIRTAIPCCPDRTIRKQQNHIVLSCLLFQDLLCQPESRTRIRLAQIISLYHQRLMDLLFYHFMVFRRKRKIPKCCLRTCSIYDQRKTNLFIIAHVYQHVQ